LLTSTALTLIVLPVVYEWMETRGEGKERPSLQQKSTSPSTNQVTG
jgi:hypothetical protein